MPSRPMEIEIYEIWKSVDFLGHQILFCDFFYAFFSRCDSFLHESFFEINTDKGECKSVCAQNTLYSSECFLTHK